jgi:CheY-like chemotaxis protein
MPAPCSKHRANRSVVLVADDDPVMRLLMLEMLEGVNLDAIEAADGVQAVASSRASARRT